MKLHVKMSLRRRKESSKKLYSIKSKLKKRLSIGSLRGKVKRFFTEQIIKVKREEVAPVATSRKVGRLYSISILFLSGS